MVKTSFSNDSIKKGKKCYHEKCTVDQQKNDMAAHEVCVTNARERASFEM